MPNTIIIRGSAAALGAVLLSTAVFAQEQRQSFDEPRYSSHEQIATGTTPSAFLLRGTASWHSEFVAGTLATDDHSTNTDVDLLERMRRGFKLPPDSHSRTQAQLRWYSRHPEYLNRVVNRAAPYWHHIIEQIEARDVPLEIALLPIVESAFDPFAYSHGRAAGLWQFIPGTGRRFGLRQDWWYDGRRDVIESTRAALDYLQYLAARYDGDWELAVAAYNSGEGTVDRAIRRNRKAGKPTDFWSLRLPKETSSYVPKLLALADIFANPSHHGLTLPTLENKPAIATVETGGQIDLALAAGLAGVDVDTLYQYNPAYNQWATSPDGPHKLVVPIAAAAALQQGLDALPANERMRWTRHRVQSGQTLSHIADRYNITQAAIRDSNNLNGTMIRAGQYLMIPTAVRPLSEYSQSADARLQRKQQRPRGDTKIEHTVRSGESLWVIAKRYGVNTRKLAAWNGLAPGDTLSVGRSLVIWKNGASGTATSPTSTSSARTRTVRYTVRQGDSLSLIAARFRVRIGDITRWNNLDRNRILRPGQKLKLIVDVTRQSS
ncbi:MAG: LysM peptidoglycan-binding domain-containing protein [Pseudomonadota bacterium]